MDNKKMQCPVCMTKMQPRGEDLICPECGYKYCANRQPYTYDDHSHSQYQTYTRQVSYAGNPPRQSPAASQGNHTQPNPHPGTASNTSREIYTRTQTASSQPRQRDSAPNPKSPLKIISTIIVVIIILNILSSVFFSLLALVGSFL